MKYLKIAAMTVVILSAHTATAEWAVDFSRRAHTVRDSDLAEMSANRAPASNESSTSAIPTTAGYGSAKPAMVQHEVMVDPKTEDKGLLGALFDAGQPVQEIVILNTEKGFVPNTVNVRKDGRYKIHVVNVNEKEKNVSFILEGFSEYHATAYGKVKTFVLEPKKDGVFSFQSPETAAEGHLVVFNPQMTFRNPAADAGNESVKK
jgi:hypothetical protein